MSTQLVLEILVAGPGVKMRREERTLLGTAILDRVGPDRLAVAVAVLREMNDAMTTYFASQSPATALIGQENFA